MRRRTFLSAGLCGAPGWAQRRPALPNIIVILLDEMGYSDLGCFGAEIETPNIDRLGAEGIRFTRFYNTARCCPSRASLLTGLYSHEAGVGHMDSDLGYPSYQGHLRRDCVTLPERLRRAGYRTVMSGKWHLGTGAGDLPWEHGFERFYGIPQGGGVYFWPTKLKRDVVRFDAADGKGPVRTTPGESFYSTDSFTDYAVEQVRSAHRDAGRRRDARRRIRHARFLRPLCAWLGDAVQHAVPASQGRGTCRRQHNPPHRAVAGQVARRRHADRTGGTHHRHCSHLPCRRRTLPSGQAARRGHQPASPLPPGCTWAVAQVVLGTPG